MYTAGDNVDNVDKRDNEAGDLPVRFGISIQCSSSMVANVVLACRCRRFTAWLLRSLFDFTCDLLPKVKTG